MNNERILIIGGTGALGGTLAKRYYHNLKNTSDLKDFKVKSSKITPNNDDPIRNSFSSWKEIVDKHFVKNQD